MSYSIQLLLLLSIVADEVVTKITLVNNEILKKRDGGEKL